jgi:ATP-dependent DNA helicase RecG
MEEYAGGIQITFLKRGNVTDNVTDNVTENRRRNIFNRIKENNRISIDQLAEILKVTRRTIIRDLEILKKQNFIKRTGPAKGGHWEVMEMKK